MIDTVGVLELLRPSRTYGSLLKAHLSFLLFQIQQSPFDVYATHRPTRGQDSRRFSIQLARHLRLIESKPHGPSGGRLRIFIAGEDTILGDTQLIVDVTHMIDGLLPVAEDVNLFPIAEIQFFHDL